MTRPADTKDTVAAAGFAGFLALALGPVGVVIAAIAVGVERAWTNGVGAGPVHEAARRGWSDRVAGHRAWLDWDRQQQARQRAAFRRWLADGGDPATRPARPGAATRFGTWLRRAWARAAVAVTEFAAGFTDGLAAARQVRAGGGSLTDIVRARPEPKPLPQPAPVGSEQTPVRQSATTVPPSLPQPSAPQAVPQPPSVPDLTPQPAIQPTPDRGAPVTTATQTAGETHADITIDKLNRIGGSIGQAENLNDQAAATAAALDAQVAAASEYADANGATAATRQALDEARAVAAAIRETVARQADLCAQAGESVAAATFGMRPAVDAQDALAAAGARGDIVATATSD